MKHAKRTLKTVVLLAVLAAGALLLTACKPTPPSNLSLTSGYPCSIEWTDTSTNEDGFNIYLGYTCVDCADATDWTKVATVGKDVTSYAWTRSCCDVKECSCAKVRAFNGGGESGDSNVIRLAPLC